MSQRDVLVCLGLVCSLWLLLRLLVASVDLVCDAAGTLLTALAARWSMGVGPTACFVLSTLAAGGWVAVRLIKG